MILSDREIRAALARGAMKITPIPDAEAWTSTAVDLRLASELVLWRKAGGKGVEAVVCPKNEDYNFDEVRKMYGDDIRMQSEGYIFKSGTFLLGWTVERIQLPHRARIAARVEGKSSLARLGIGMHVTAPTIHAGFGYINDNESYKGSPLQLEMWNCGPLDVKLVPDMAICQLIFESVDGTPEKGYDGNFSIQGPTIDPLS